MYARKTKTESASFFSHYAYGSRTNLLYLRLCTERITHVYGITMPGTFCKSGFEIPGAQVETLMINHPARVKSWTRIKIAKMQTMRKRCVPSPTKCVRQMIALAKRKHSRCFAVQTFADFGIRSFVSSPNSLFGDLLLNAHSMSSSVQSQNLKIKTNLFLTSVYKGERNNRSSMLCGGSATRRR